MLSVVLYLKPKKAQTFAQQGIPGVMHVKKIAEKPFSTTRNRLLEEADCNILGSSNYVLINRGENLKTSFEV